MRMMNCPGCDRDLKVWDSYSPVYSDVTGNTYQNWTLAKAAEPSLGLLNSYKCEDCGTVWGSNTVDWSSVDRKPWGDRKRKRREKQSTKALADSYQRKTQLVSAHTGSDFVHYGKFGNLAKAGYEVPDGFRGTSNQLANQLGIEHRRLAKIVRVTEEELSSYGELWVSE